MATYRVVPFNPDLKEKEVTSGGETRIAQQMQQAIAKEAASGWTFEGYQAVQVAVRPGCLAVLGGGKGTTVSYGVLVFSRPA